MLELKHLNTSTSTGGGTGDGPGLLLNGYYSSNEWALAKIAAVNAGGEYGSGYAGGLQFWVHPANGTQTAAVVKGAELIGDGSGANLTINNGNLVIGTAGHGIDFSASSDSSGTNSSELLDEYEEGTYTPTINVGTFTTFLTHRYIKIGRLVHLHGGLIFHNNSSGTRVEISNIPFTQQNGQQFVGNVWLRRTSTGERNWNMVLGEAGTNILGIFRDSNGNDMGGHLSYSDFQHSSTYFNYSITYIAAS